MFLVLMYSHSIFRYPLWTSEACYIGLAPIGIIPLPMVVVYHTKNKVLEEVMKERNQERIRDT